MTRAEMLETARKCVCGDREQDYGSPESNFSTIAKLWTAYNGNAYTAQDVAIMLALLKIGRIASGNVKEDNYVDLAGYAACACEIMTHKIVESEPVVLPKMRPTCDFLAKQYYCSHEGKGLACCKGRPCTDKTGNCPIFIPLGQCLDYIEDSVELYEKMRVDIEKRTGDKV